MKITDPTEGELTQIGLPLKITFNTGRKYRLGEEKIFPPPKWGQHTDEVLKNLGYNESDIKEFMAHGII